MRMIHAHPKNAYDSYEKKFVVPRRWDKYLIGEFTELILMTHIYYLAVADRPTTSVMSSVESIWYLSVISCIFVMHAKSIEY